MGIGLDLPGHGSPRRCERCSRAAGPAERLGINNPAELSEVLGTLQGIADDFNDGRSDDVRISLADLIVLAGSAAIEHAASDAGTPVEVAFRPGRTDASQEQTDVESFAVLEPTTDGFRNFLGKGHSLRAEELLVERARLLGLTLPQLTVLVGGMRALGANYDGSDLGVLADRPGALSDDFFVNLLADEVAWTPVDADAEVFEGRDRTTGAVRWTGSRVDLVFGSNSQLRAQAEVYASDDAAQKLDFRGCLGHGHGAGPLRPALSAQACPDR